MQFPGEEMYREAKDHLVSLLRIDTTNPPGNEIAAARYLQGVLAHEGIEHKIFEPAPGRGSIMARLVGSGERPPLLLMGHLDVVPARAADWQHHPFGGETAEGAIWGRGALDCKDLVAGWTTILIWLHRLSVPLRRDVVLLATADEEAGGTWGMGWIAEHHPELLRAEAALNEGGGGSFPIGGKTLFTCQTAEKGVCWLRLTATGQAGHASVPTPENAVTRLARAVSQLGSTQLPLHLTSTVEATLSALVEAGGPDLGRALRHIISTGGKREDLEQLLPREKAASLYASLRNTLSPTVLRAGEKTNVIPREAVAEIDGRLLPGFTTATFLAEVQEVLAATADQEVHLETIMSAEPSESPFDTPLADCLRQVLARRVPGSTLVPHMSTGMTDGRFPRRLGTPVYGFWPYPPHVPSHLIHGTDERVPEDAYRFALHVMWEAIVSFCG